jgi:quinol monooxygenase YgiN
VKISHTLSLLALSLFFQPAPMQSQTANPQVVRIAELEIDPAQTDQYKAALKEEIEASIRIEPGVITLYAVSIRDNPTHLRILEVYANDAAYKSHLETPHFKKYKVATQNMVKSLKLIETDPVILGAKPPSAKKAK